MKNIAIILLLFVVNACKQDLCITNEIAPISDAVFNKTGTVNTPIKVTISYGSKNGCFTDGFVRNTKNNFNIYFDVVANYQGCMCTEIAVLASNETSFILDKKGTYLLHFLQLNNQYKVDTLIIN